jgi:hypothetical protein
MANSCFRFDQRAPLCCEQCGVPDSHRETRQVTASHHGLLKIHSVRQDRLSTKMPYLDEAKSLRFVQIDTRRLHRIECGTFSSTPRKISTLPCKTNILRIVL